MTIPLPTKGVAVNSSEKTLLWEVFFMRVDLVEVVESISSTE